MGDKYILEVESIYDTVQGSEREPVVLYKAKGFNGLVFDEASLNKLEKFDPKNGKQEYENGYSYGYNAGLDDAWDVSRKIVLSDEDGFTFSELERIFGTNDFDTIFSDVPVNVAISKIKAYEEKKKAEDEIQVGDEVKVNDVNGVVTRKRRAKGGDLCIDVMFSDGSGFLYSTTTNTVTKTNRHFPEVVELLKKIHEAEEE